MKADDVKKASKLIAGVLNRRRMLADLSNPTHDVIVVNTDWGLATLGVEKDDPGYPQLRTGLQEILKADLLRLENELSALGVTL